MEETYAKLLITMLRLVAEQKGITQAQIAERTGLKQPAVSRFFEAESMPRLGTFLAVGRAVGVFLFLEDKEGGTELANLMQKAMHTVRGNPDSPERKN